MPAANVQSTCFKLSVAEKSSATYIIIVEEGQTDGYFKEDNNVRFRQTPFIEEQGGEITRSLRTHVANFRGFMELAGDPGSRQTADLFQGEAKAKAAFQE